MNSDTRKQPLPSGQSLRIATGLVLAAALVTCLILGGLPFFIMLLAVSLAALLELYGLFWRGFSRPLSKLAGLLGGAAVMAIAAGMLPACLEGRLTAPGILSGLALLAAFSFLAGYGGGNTGARFGDYAVLPFGVVYVPLALGFAYQLSPAEMFLVVGAVAASDTGAYFLGSAMGRHKIWPAVSPRKSWEGAVGGFLACLLVVLCAGWFAVRAASPGQTPPAPPPDPGGLVYWLLIGAAMAVASQLGDFFESALKRSAGVKDSSRLLPGHGGMLDRIDSLLFALPAYVLMKNLLGAAAWAKLPACFGP
jgi:phosphatidate cytidylyltransferase